LCPHKSRYWEHPNISNWEKFEERVGELCEINASASDLHKQGIHVISTDENPTMPMTKGNCENENLTTSATVHRYL